jgi:hypothetical protein
LVDDELARAIRQESAAAIKYWWGVGSNAVWKWRQALARGCGKQPITRPRWTTEELALLGTAPDEEIALKIGKTKRAVGEKRCQLGIPNPCDRRRREYRT